MYIARLGPYYNSACIGGLYYNYSARIVPVSHGSGSDGGKEEKADTARWVDRHSDIRVKYTEVTVSEEVTNHCLVGH